MSHTCSRYTLCITQLQSGHNIHRLQLLEEQFASIWQLHLGHVVRRLEAWTTRKAQLCIVVSQQATVGAHMNLHTCQGRLNTAGIATKQASDKIAHHHTLRKAWTATKTHVQWQIA